MSTEAEQVKALIAKEFPPHMQRDALAHLWNAYEAASRRAREFDEAQQRKVYGHERLALVEQSFKLFSRKHGLMPDDFRPDGSSYEFFTMRSQSLVITLKSITAPGILPPPCVFRDTLATGDQFSLFEEAPDVAAGRKYFHLLILHNAARRLVEDPVTKEKKSVRIRNRPGFVELAVPTRDGLDCLHRFSFFEAYPDTVSQLRGHTREGISEADQNRPKPRKQRSDEDTGTK